MAAPAGHARLATLLLVSVTAVWGSTFFLIHDLVEHVPPADFLAVRFGIAAVVMFVLFRRQTLALTRRELRVGVVLGLLYGVAQVLQTTGLAHTDASVSGFITGTYVVLTPVLGAVLLHDRIGKVTWFAVGLATLGLALLSLQGFSVGIGEALTLLSAILYAGHIVALGRWSTPGAAFGLATVQACVITVVAAVRGRARRAHPARHGGAVGLAALHGPGGRRAGALGADLGPGAPHRHARGDRHGPRAGLRGAVRGDAGR